MTWSSVVSPDAKHVWIFLKRGDHQACQWGGGWESCQPMFQMREEEGDSVLANQVCKERCSCASGGWWGGCLATHDLPSMDHHPFFYIYIYIYIYICAKWVFENLGENMFERWQLKNSKIKKLWWGEGW
jgi:hypothetical protein